MNESFYDQKKEQGELPPGIKWRGMKLKNNE